MCPTRRKKYLESLVDFKITKVRRFAEPKEGMKPFHWWVVTTENREQILELKKIKFFTNSCPIKWEPYVSKRSPRCYNCQEHKHLAKNCFKKERCTRCKTTHSATNELQHVIRGETSVLVPPV